MTVPVDPGVRTPAEVADVMKGAAGAGLVDSVVMTAGAMTVAVMTAVRTGAVGADVRGTIGDVTTGGVMTGTGGAPARA
ncbi:hypothetical protein [Streptomyces axinellae]|uniref:CBS domain-containing protein n=1 Tax=Streptomyces axinellae TaxID=552788 RepID=A0ABN3QRB3_9ACTN